MTIPDERREALVDRFRDLLEKALTEEAPPTGIAAEVWAEIVREDGAVNEVKGEAGEDLYAIWSALTAQTQEIKLQGRAFNQLHERLEPTVGLGERVDQVLALHREALTEARRIAEEGRGERHERERELRREVEQRVRREMLANLVTLRDRLTRGLDALRAGRQTAPPRTGWLAGIFGSDRGRHEHLTAGIAALEKGYRLSLDYLEESLAEYQVREIECQGRPFDPHMMEAVDREESSRVAAGTVLEVYQRGYLWQGELYRPARVKVAAAPQGAEQHAP